MTREGIDEQKLLLTALVALAPLGAQTIVIQNATIMTVTHGTIKGSVVVKDGKIAEVGEKVMVPAGATVIDASGQYVIPGIIDCHSHIAGDGGINEGSVSVSSMVDIRDVINPEDISIYRALAGGVTTANILHGSANAIGGQTLPLKMRWGKDAQEMIFEGATPGIKFALGENPKRAGNPQGGRGAATPDTRRAIPPRAWAWRTYPRGVQRSQGLQGRVGRLQRQGRDGRASDSAAQGPEARAAEGSARRQALRALALLSRRRDPDAAPRGRRLTASRSAPSSTCSKATRSPRRSRRTAPAHPPSATGGLTRSRRSTPFRTTPPS